MLPGINPKQMAQAMKKLGIKQEEIEAYEVIIKTNDKNLVIKNPQVIKINMGGEQSLQITGEINEEQIISEDDVNTVAEQANVNKDTARNALEKNNGNLAEAIMDLQNK